MDSELTTPTDKALQDALSPLVNNIIDSNYESTKEQMTAHISPLLGPAIKEQVQTQKDDIVDALYPVMGNMISRYVSKSLEEMLFKINSQMQHGFSAKSIKRKIKAKITGVSETELLFNENANSDIRAIFLIHKDTGIVLAQAQNPNYAIHEPDMMASMMTAIRSFVNDCISQNDATQELGEIEYGGSKIILEASSHSYLAIMVEGASYQATSEKIRDVFGTIITKYGKNIREFEGDLDNFAQLHVDDELTTLLLNDTEEEEEENTKAKIHPMLYILPLLLLSWIAYSYYTSYQNKTLTKTASKQLYHTPALTTYRLDVGVKDGTATLKGEVPYSYHKNLADKTVRSIEGIEELKNEIIVVPTLSDPTQINLHIAYLLKGFNLQKGVSLHYNYDYETLTLLGHTLTQEQKGALLQELHKIEGLKSIQDQIVVTPVFKDTTIYFERGVSSLSITAQDKLVKIIKVLSSAGNDVSLVLKSYTDLIGSSQDNDTLAQKRMNTILAFLQVKGKIQNKITTHNTNQVPEGVDPLKEPEKARCVSISYKKENSDSI